MDVDRMKEFLEAFQEELIYAYEGWVFDTVPGTVSFDAVAGFVDYAVQKAKDDIVRPRVGGSYEELAR